MENNNTNNTKLKINDILKLKGPSLPVQIAREIQLSSLFAGALLSELAKEKIIKISNMKVGGSPLYFLQGQEPLLENFHKYLPGKEKEAFILLKQNKILDDKKQVPAIRVALRNLKDFAFPFLKDQEVFWRFHSVSEQEVRELDKSKKLEKKQEVKLPKSKISKEKQVDIGLKKAPQEIKPKKEKEKPDFAVKIIDLLQTQNIAILEEKDVKKKEFSAIISIGSTLGKINFFCIAKDKKRITENDLRLVLQKSQALKMPALVLFPQNINKKAIEYAEKWSSLLKLKKFQ